MQPEGRLAFNLTQLVQKAQINTTIYSLSQRVVRSSKLANLYLLGVALDNSINEGDGFGVTITGDSIKFYTNNVVFEQWSQFGINYSGNWDDLFITNTRFRNFVNPGSDYTGEAIRYRNDLAKLPQDSVVIKGCTFLGINGYVACVGVTSYIRYIDFEHNSVVGVYKNPFFSENATNWTVAHNIFYAAYAGGMADGEYPWWDRIWAPGISSVIDVDTLNKAIAGSIVDTTQTNWIALGEAARKIVINDNLYFMPASISTYVTDWNDTTTGTDSIYTCPWMNPYSVTMFGNHSNFINTANLTTTDPVYGAGIAGMIGAPGTTVPASDGIGLLPWLAESRSHGDVATDFWGYAQSKPDYSSGNWEPVWPLPEMASGDLKYTASLLAADGKPYGDPYWFTDGPLAVKKTAPVATTYSLSQNYPNPFNPTTQIDYSVKQNGFVTLKVYNILGQEVQTLFSGQQTAGLHTAKLDGTNLASGVYIYRMQAGSVSISKKMVLLK